jgi:hypothetical protein
MFSSMEACPVYIPAPVPFFVIPQRAAFADAPASADVCCSFSF